MFRNIRTILLVVSDAILIAASVYLSYLLRFDFKIRNEFLDSIPYVIAMSIVCILIGLASYKIYKRIWQYASVGDMLAIFKGALAGSIAFFCFHQVIYYYMYTNWVIPRSIFPLTVMISFLAIGGSRFVWRLLRDSHNKLQPHHRRALIVGAGEAGIIVVRELKHNPSAELYPVAFIDDDVLKQKLEVHGVPVVGTRADISEVVRQYKIDDIVLAIPTASREDVKEIINLGKVTGCQIKIVPKVNDLISGKIMINTIRNVSVEDLLGREPVKVDLDEIAGYLKDQVVMVTGAGGSIGSEISRQVAAMKPKQLVVLDHGENSIYDIEMELLNTYSELPLVALILDIKDSNRLDQIFDEYRPDVVFHAAAHKHVPLMESNPLEAVKNNVFGTRNLSQCAHKYSAKRFVLISTDKAVNPTNVMGATKRVAEMIIQDVNADSGTIFSAVRFGNVLGSRGSVIPLFKKQIENGGPVTVTHPEMVRYFMTIPEAVQLVIQAGAIASGGEIFILDMGKPVKISDLAKDLISLSGLEPDKDIKIEYTGIRPGEKLFEELLSKEEGAIATKHDRIFVGNPVYFSREHLHESLHRMSMMRHSEEVREHLGQLVTTYQWNKGASNVDQSRMMLQASLELVAALEDKK